jgi:hypothetical protein
MRAARFVYWFVPLAVALVAFALLLRECRP